MTELSKRTGQFAESVIREMTRLCERHGALNLSQGFPDFEPHPKITDALIKAVEDGYNQYSYTWGLPELRHKLAEIIGRDKGLNYDPEEEIVITCGASEAVIASLMACVNPGDRVVIIEPFYENYIPGCIMTGTEPVLVALDGMELNRERMEKAFEKRPSALILNTPHNPSGKVFGPDELQFIAGLCREYDTAVITDETYEYIYYDGHSHIAPASLTGMEDRTVTVSSFGKTFGVTGWRIGYAAAKRPLIEGVRKAHDYLTICAPAPQQRAMTEILDLPESYFEKLRNSYTERRDLTVKGLREIGFELETPEGAYYIMADYGRFSDEDDRAFAEYLVREAGVGTVPGNSFYRSAEKTGTTIRFSFPRKKETLEPALEKLKETLCG